jgi:hypothetical protein
MARWFVRERFEMKEKCFINTLKRDFKKIGVVALLAGATILLLFIAYLGADATHTYIVPIVLPHITGYNCYIIASCVAILIGVLISLSIKDSDDLKSLSDASATSCLLVTELLLAGVYFITLSWANPQWFYIPTLAMDFVYQSQLMAAPTIEWVAFSLAALVIITAVTAYARCRD